MNHNRGLTGKGAPLITGLKGCVTQVPRLGCDILSFTKTLPHHHVSLTPSPQDFQTAMSEPLEPSTYDIFGNTVV